MPAIVKKNSCECAKHVNTTCSYYVVLSLYTTIFIYAYTKYKYWYNFTYLHIHIRKYSQKVS